MTAKLGFIAKIPDDAIPTEFQVFPFGRVSIEGSDPFTVDGASMSAAIAQFASRGLDMVIDYEHQTEENVQAPAAGWIKALENRGLEGLWAKVEWTEKAREYLANREYRYYSPVFLVSKGARKLLELLRVALTNAPRLNWIRPIVAKNLNPEGKEMEFLKLVAKSLGLPETSTEAEVTAKLAELQQQLKEVVASKDVLDALGLAASASRSEIVASIHALKQRPGAEFQAEVADLKKRLAERDRDDLVAAALKAGKITPAQKDWAENYALTDAEGFKLFVAKAPVVVPVDQLPGYTPKPGAGNPAAYAAQLEINKLMGISDEVWKKHNPQ